MENDITDTLYYILINGEENPFTNDREKYRKENEVEEVLRSTLTKKQKELLNALMDLYGER